MATGLSYQYYEMLQNFLHTIVNDELVNDHDPAHV